MDVGKSTNRHRVLPVTVSEEYHNGIVMRLQAEIDFYKDKLAEARKLLNCTHNPPSGKIGF